MWRFSCPSDSSSSLRWCSDDGYCMCRSLEDEIWSILPLDRAVSLSVLRHPVVSRSEVAAEGRAGIRYGGKVVGKAWTTGPTSKLPLEDGGESWTGFWKRLTTGVDDQLGDTTSFPLSMRRTVHSALLSFLWSRLPQVVVFGGAL